MIQVSKRHVPALVALGAVTAATVWVHGQGLLDRDDCADPARLRALLQAGEESRPPANGEANGKEDRPEILQWIAGSLAGSDPSGSPLSFAVVRSTDPPRLTGRPHHPVLNGLEATRRELRWVEDESGGALPIHWTVGSRGRRARFAAYLFVYRDRPVRRPTLALLASAPGRLLSGARPLTLMVVGGEVSTGELEESREAAEAWILDAWQRYRRACRAPASPSAARTGNEEGLAGP